MSPHLPRRHVARSWRIAVRPFHVAALLLASAFALSPAHAQGGGMRGGGMGGRGGGMGGRGGGMGGRGGSMQSPADAARKNFKESDQIAFFLDKKKPLALTHPQRDSLKSLQKDMRHMQEPLFKEMDKLTSDMMAGRSRGEGRGEGRRGGRGGGEGAGGDDRGGDRGGERGGGRGGVSDTVRGLVARITDIQEAYRDRARGQLTEPQRHMADSLFSAKLAEQRKKDEEERAKRRR